MMIGIVVIGALLIVVGLIMLGGQPNREQPEEVSGPAEVSQFPTLGEETAPVTIVEYSDYG
jgi:protein-disulfide isomerase